MWKFLEKRPFFRADMAGLGKYCMGGYDRIGVYREWWPISFQVSILVIQHLMGMGCKAGCLSRMADSVCDMRWTGNDRVNDERIIIYTSDLADWGCSKKPRTMMSNGAFFRFISVSLSSCNASLDIILSI